MVLDLAGGTGSISRRLLARCPQARTVLLDVDPALLAVARGSFGADRRVTVCDADLRDDAWPDLARAAANLGDRPFDAVLSATALHWLTPSRLHTVYGQATGLLRDGGVLANADHMADTGLYVLAERIAGIEADRSEARRRASGADDWDTWWQHLAAEPDMKDLLRQREERFAGHGGSEHTESDQPVEWHLDALRAAGLGAVGVVWRHLGDAVVLGVRTSTA